MPLEFLHRTFSPGDRSRQGYPAQFNIPQLVVLALVFVIYLFILNGFFAGGDVFVSDNLSSRHLMVNILSRTSVMLISTVFGCLFLAIPLTASFYTPQVIELFVQSRTNIAVLALFVFSAAHCVWLARVAPDVYISEFQFGMGLVLVTATLVVLLPYLFSIFRLLNPRVIINRVAWKVIQATRPNTKKTPADNRAILERRIGNLGNIILRTLARSDSEMTVVGIKALERCAINYMKVKAEHPEDWFVVEASQFPGLSQEAMELVNQQHTWVEMEFVQQLNRAYAAAILTVPDVISALSLTQRYLALEASKRGDLGALDLWLRHFNNFLREAVKRKNVHAVYDLLYQYRRLAENIWEHYPDRVVELSRHLDYYGMMADQSGIPFAHELVTYDLGLLIAHVTPGCPEFDELLDVFLSIGKVTGPEEKPELTPRMFKARVLTAAYLRQAGHTEPAERIVGSMVPAPAHHLETARKHLLGDVEKWFWEITDRQQNLDYSEEALRPVISEILDEISPGR